ncbi:MULTISPECIES: hypothetical protein [Stenotrophomonas maltophilia group]|nr:hypothetical protein [Stenotrophomonas maltophilia]UGB23798.1 hypothetical protein LQ335_08890 [Stenotrophomonas maltophilia]
MLVRRAEGLWAAYFHGQLYVDREQGGACAQDDNLEQLGGRGTCFR